MSTPATPQAPAAPAANQAKPGTAPAQGTNPAGQAPGQPVAVEAPRMLKVKIDGQVVDMPENEVLELASAGKVANQRFQEAARMRKEAEGIFSWAKQNPVEFFKKTGMNPREWAEQYLLTELQKEAESPEQKQLRTAQEKLRTFEQKEKADVEAKKAKELQDATNMQRERLDKLFTDALLKSGLPRTKFTVKRMAELQLINIRNKYELPPERLAQLVREDYVAEQKSLLGSLEGDQLLDFLGPDLAKKLSKAQIAKLKARGAGTGTGGQGRRDPAPKKEDEGLTWKELQKRNRKPA